MDSAKNPTESKHRYTLRIKTPKDQVPFVYIMTQVGSLSLTKARMMSLAALSETDLTLSLGEREGMRTIMMLAETPPTDLAQSDMRPRGGTRTRFSDDVLADEFYANVVNFKTWPKFTERERLAMELAQRFTHDHKSINGDDAFWERLNANFTDREIVDMFLLAGIFTGQGYFADAVGLIGGHAGRKIEEDAPPVVGDGSRRMLKMIAEREAREANR